MSSKNDPRSLKRLMPELQWEPVGTRYDGHAELWRIPVPGGWLVDGASGDAQGVFVPDPNHDWGRGRVPEVGAQEKAESHDAE